MERSSGTSFVNVGIIIILFIIIIIIMYWMVVFYRTIIELVSRNLYLVVRH